MTTRSRKPSTDVERLFVGLAAVSRVIRARERLSQAEVARRAGLAKTTISSIENGRANPTMLQILQLAKGLGLTGATELMSQADDNARLIADGTMRPTQ
jgi:transcriptional regulator with XRE-family HTH domain